MAPANPNYEWIAAEVAGTAESLTIKLNDVEKQGYEIFTVTALLFPNAHGWVVVGRKKLAGSQPELQAEPTSEQREREPQRRGTVTLKPRRG